LLPQAILCGTWRIRRILIAHSAFCVDPFEDQLSGNLWVPPTVPRFYPHSEWAAMGPVHVEVRFQAQARHSGDGPGLPGAAI
jgi:hypothetical protein